MVEDAVHARYGKQKGTRCSGAICAAATFILVLSPAALAAPEAELWPRWAAHDPTSRASIEHGPWSRVLGAYLVRGTDGVARFDYASVTVADSRALASYVASLSDLSIGDYNRREQLAYWVNFYNALTVKLVLEHYPVPSIRNIKPSGGWFSLGPWDEALVTVEGERLSLNDIEHRILRPVWRDPRVHYALNCASVGCPNLREIAFTADNAETLLDVGAREYINDPRGVRFVDGDLVVSSIYHWFKSDFGGSDRGVIEHLRRYAAPELVAALRNVRRMGGYHYDWSLNDAASVVTR